MTASGRAAWASSGRISGLGLEGEDQGVLRHPRQPGGLEDAAGGKTEEDVRVGQGLLQGAVGGVHGIARLVGIHDLGATGVDHPGDVGDQDVLAAHAQGHQQVQAGQGGGPGPGGDQAGLLDLLAHQQ